ncbi:MAG: glycoside hydrolase family 3 C-terminal domain-containing protein, partial [Fibromonadales bacterium]|nr:glycoside hydrolase family 3 C-terminal domain-containing protein [Fibromonadales bacterium]
NEILRSVHLPGYEALVEQGVLSVMASFNTIDTVGNGQRVHQHVDSLRLTGWLKTELGFDGFIISDWQGIAHSTSPGYVDPGGYGYNPCRTNPLPGLTTTAPSLTQAAVRNAINAGIDHAMEPQGSHTQFITHLTNLVNDNQVSMDRIDDAVRRILRAKFRAGIMDDISVAGPSEYLYNTTSYRNSTAHKEIAREAVRKSQVLLKNDGTLPLSKNGNIHVFGSHSNDIALQSGGWTISWQGASGNSSFSGVGTSVLSGMQQVSGQSTFGTVESSNIIVYVTGESPTYAEWCGDISSLDFTPSNTDMNNIANYRSQGKKIVTVFVTGRPRIVPELLAASDAFVVAWLPGTEGAGIADVLFGDYAPTGKLPMAWPAGSETTDYPYGFGLNY